MTRLPLGEVWRDAAQRTRAHFAILATLAAAFVMVPAVGLELAYPAMGAAGRALTRAEMRAMALPFFGIGLIQLYGQLAMIAVVTDNGRSTVGAAMSRALGALPRVILALVVYAIGIAALTFLLAMVLVIPTALVGTSQTQVQQTATLLMLLMVGPLVYTCMRLSLVTPPAVIAQAGPVESLRQSWRATKGNFFPLLGLIVPTLCALLVAQGLVSMVVGGTARALDAMLGGHLAQFIASLVTAAASAAAAVYFTMLLVSVWQRLRSAD